MKYPIDLRSDTVTLPPLEMRKAIARAELGDDVYGEDPTVHKLEALTARMLGKESALLTPSGTMANLLAILGHCPRRKRLLVGDLSDIWRWEAGGGSILGGLVYHPLPTNTNGEIPVEEMEDALYGEDDPQCVRTGLICLENTHCLSGGRVLSLPYLSRVRDFARTHFIPVHLDGARIFNAAVAAGLDVRQITEFADSVTVCLSKSLAAPVGSLVAGSREFIQELRRLRKMIGGGMRQAGVLAAAGIYALEHMMARLTEDHDNAKHLAAGLAQVPGIEISPEPPQTNMVFWTLSNPDLNVRNFLCAVENHGVRISELGKRRIRAVTHYGISRQDTEYAIRAVRSALQQTERTTSEDAAARRRYLHEAQNEGPYMEVVAC